MSESLVSFQNPFQNVASHLSYTQLPESLMRQRGINKNLLLVCLVMNICYLFESSLCVGSSDIAHKLWSKFPEVDFKKKQQL